MPTKTETRSFWHLNRCVLPFYIEKAKSSLLGGSSTCVMHYPDDSGSSLVPCISQMIKEALSCMMHCRSSKEAVCYGAISILIYSNEAVT
eukprot:scaffold8561_cov130-Skeletonema_marinoi.AAC.1